MFSSTTYVRCWLQRVVIQDLVRGQVSWDAEATVGDFILLRSTGVPVYNFCVAGETTFVLHHDMLMTLSRLVQGCFMSRLWMCFQLLLDETSLQTYLFRAFVLTS